MCYSPAVVSFLPFFASFFTLSFSTYSSPSPSLPRVKNEREEKNQELIYHCSFSLDENETHKLQVSTVIKYSTRFFRSLSARQTQRTNSPAALPTFQTFCSVSVPVFLSTKDQRNEEHDPCHRRQKRSASRQCLGQPSRPARSLRWTRRARVHPGPGSRWQEIEEGRAAQVRHNE